MPPAAVTEQACPQWQCYHTNNQLQQMFLMFSNHCNCDGNIRNEHILVYLSRTCIEYWGMDYCLKPNPPILFEILTDWYNSCPVLCPPDISSVYTWSCKSPDVSTDPGIQAPAQPVMVSVWAAHSSVAAAALSRELSSGNNNPWTWRHTAATRRQNRAPAREPGVLITRASSEGSGRLHIHEKATPIPYDVNSV